MISCPVCGDPIVDGEPTVTKHDGDYGAPPTYKIHDGCDNDPITPPKEK